MSEQVRIWVREGRIVTLDSAGSTSGWTRQEAEDLHATLGNILRDLPVVGDEP